jgi:bifunctional ADP-heptose synthase (sugar kinase/adenylyltransferase)
MPMAADQIRALTEANAQLGADKGQLERVSAELGESNKLLEQENGHLKQQVRLLQVAVTISLAGITSLSAELATRMLGATAQTAFDTATVVFFAFITASLAILGFMHRS